MGRLTATFGWLQAARLRAVAVEPRSEHGEEGGGVLQVGGVAGAGHEGDGGVGADRLAEAAGLGAELRVGPAGDDEHRHGEAVESVPQGVLGAGTGLAERLREALDGVLRPLGPELDVVAEAGEEGLGQPGVDEGGDALALDPPRHGLVLGGAGDAGLPVVDAARGADEHEAPDELRQRERQVEDEAPAHRVAEVGGFPALVGDEAGTGAEVGVERRAEAVARGVDAADLVVADEVVEHGTPTVAVLREAVDQDESRPPPRHFSVQHGRRGHQPSLPDPFRMCGRFRRDHVPFRRRF